ncbi:MAG TPA: carboxypeptidase regulatory-like domain-containing protein [Longimicrobiaceae bacterium]|nr:carboxypeptidase regulatory-like domain-containing protein [Longimicrobiaceae bacterium]
MQTAVRSLLALCALSLLAPAAVHAQRQARATLEVVVMDQGTRQPVAGATVRVSGVSRPVTTDAEGRARVAGVEAGARLVGVTRVGYAPARSMVEFPAGETVEAEVLLPAQAVELQTLRVTSWGRRTALVRNGFYDRQRTGMGTYFVREQIEAMRPMHLTDVIRRVRGFQVIPKPRGGGYTVVSRRSVNVSGTSMFCYPLVFVDGVRLGSDALDFVPWHEVEAVEGYAGPATIPPQYNPTGTACGVLLLWTRSV